MKGKGVRFFMDLVHEGKGPESRKQTCVSSSQEFSRWSEDIFALGEVFHRDP